MSDKFKFGDTKKCEKCGHLAFVLSPLALQGISIALSVAPGGMRLTETSVAHENGITVRTEKQEGPDLITTQSSQYAPAWVCSNCGNFEEISN